MGMEEEEFTAKPLRPLRDAKEEGDGEKRVAPQLARRSLTKPGPGEQVNVGRKLGPRSVRTSDRALFFLPHSSCGGTPQPPD